MFMFFLSLRKIRRSCTPTYRFIGPVGLSVPSSLELSRKFPGNNEKLPYGYRKNAQGGPATGKEWISVPHKKFLENSKKSWKILENGFVYWKKLTEFHWFLFPRPPNHPKILKNLGKSLKTLENHWNSKNKSGKILEISRISWEFLGFSRFTWRGPFHGLGPP